VTLVGVDWSDKPTDAMLFIRRHHWLFPILGDESGTGQPDIQANR
jgi:hypothetical protein